MIKTITLVAFFLLTREVIYAQKITHSVIGSLGSSSNTDGTIYQQSIGQPAIVTHEKSDNGTGLRQGFLQPLTFTVESNELDVHLFPNPNQGEFAFQVNVENDTKFNYQLFDQSGKLIEFNSGVGNSLVPVKIANPAQGLYHLKVSTDSKTSSFKIIVIP
jgi:hypothetical protein